jgi:uncharacterized protein (TIGR02996 family)
MLAVMAEPLDPALEARICEDPDDEARWRAYADWLVAQGSPRGELAAVQLARKCDDSPALAAREAELLVEHAALLRGSYAARYTRFLDDLCTVRYEAGFWRKLSFSGSAAELGLVLAHPSARLLHTLHVHYVDGCSDAYDSAITALATAEPRPSALRELRVGVMPEGQSDLVSFGDRTCGNLGALARACPRLTTLRLLCPSFDLGHQALPSLRVLDARTGASPSSLAALARARLPQLEQLDLGFETAHEDDVMWPVLAWPDDALDELLAALDVAMPALRRLRLWPMPNAPEHPLLARLADMPRIEVCDWDGAEDDADGTYEL